MPCERAAGAAAAAAATSGGGGGSDELPAVGRAVWVLRPKTFATVNEHDAAAGWALGGNSHLLGRKLEALVMRRVASSVVGKLDCKVTGVKNAGRLTRQQLRRRRHQHAVALAGGLH